MLDIVLSLMALIAGGITLELFAVAHPPLTDKHEVDALLGKYAMVAVQVEEEFQCGNPS